MSCFAPGMVALASASVTIVFMTIRSIVSHLSDAYYAALETNYYSTTAAQAFLLVGMGDTTLPMPPGILLLWSNIASACWKREPKQRPTFVQLDAVFQDAITLLEAEAAPVFALAAGIRDQGVVVPADQNAGEGCARAASCSPPHARCGMRALPRVSLLATSREEIDTMIKGLGGAVRRAVRKIARHALPSLLATLPPPLRAPPTLGAVGSGAGAPLQSLIAKVLGSACPAAGATKVAMRRPTIAALSLVPCGASCLRNACWCSTRSTRWQRRICWRGCMS